MKRWLFNILTVLSLSLCLGVVVLWARSYGNSDFVQVLVSEPARMPMTTTAQAEAWERLRQTRGWDAVYTARFMATAFSKGNWYSFWGTQGQIVTDRTVLPPRFMWGTNCSQLLLLNDSVLVRSGIASSNADWAGFSFLHFSLGTSSDTRRLGLPLWVAWLLTIVLPTIHVLKLKKSKRKARCGLCPRCRYDLRAHAAGQRCPECGWSIPADFPRPNSGAVEQAKDGRDVPSQT